MREHFRARLVAKESKPDLEGLGERAAELGYVSPSEAPVVETRNVFEEVAWDYELEKARRVKGGLDTPYVIHVDERHEAEHTETTMTYFAKDDVLLDEREQPVAEPDDIVGIENLDRFGHGSGDPNLVYIRNNMLGVDIEVRLSDGSYEEEVLGMKHSDTRKATTLGWLTVPTGRGPTSTGWNLRSARQGISEGHIPMC